MILDGYGLSDTKEHNAIAIANTPVMDELMRSYPFVKGEASGLAVGLPEGQMGNSEVGHLNIGAGRIIYQELTRISKEINDGVFFENAALLSAIANCKEKTKNGNPAALHLFGLVSDGGVHSHNTHIYGLLEMAKRNDFAQVFVHCLLDGRDTPPSSGKGYVEELESQMAKIGVGKVATVMGRYYAMDRDNNYDRVEIAYEAMTKGSGAKMATASEAIAASYALGETDEFMKPAVIIEAGEPVAQIKDGDSVIFFNFRPDRAREISRAFCDDDFQGFARGSRLDVKYVCFTDYDPTIANKDVAFHQIAITATFGEWLAAKGKKQLRLAETEKYAHVTFFFNGGNEVPNPGETRILVDSPKDVATYDMKPEMSAYEVCDRLIEAIAADTYDVIIINFANPDMVGHTGVEPAVIKAIAVVDECIGRTVTALREKGGAMFLCADHGNAEQLIDSMTGEPFTAHTTNPVPFILINYDPAYTLREGGCLADVVPTLIAMMGEEQPKEMTGVSLLQKKVT